MTVYLYSADTLEFCGHYEVAVATGETPALPAFATTLVPPGGANKAARWNVTRADWELVPDYRKVSFWQKTTKAKQAALVLGERPNSDWTELEPVGFVKWDTTTSRWVADLDAEYAAELQLCLVQRQSAYSSEADPIFFQASRNETNDATGAVWTMANWTAKVADIKTRFPKPTR